MSFMGQIHPGVRIALDRLRMNELGVARAMAAGELASPQRYENVSLFALRITGTEVAYRRAINEIVYRKPENYLNEEFLARCNGLPIIWVHPEKGTLTSAEYAKRNVGSMFLPYIKGDEVWGIAKIYDDATIEALEKEQLSTSPAVYFGDPSVNTKVKTENGTPVLIEGDPSLIDHLALVPQGVWDKGGPPTGVDAGIIRGDSNTMTEEEKKAAADKARKDAEEKEAKAKADAEAGGKLDKLLAGIDAMSKMCDGLSKRMDSFEAAQKKPDGKRNDGDDGAMPGDPEGVMADKKRKDAEEKEAKEASEKADAARKDAEEREAKAKADADDLRKKIADMEQRIPKAMSDADYGAMADAQARADTTYQALGGSAPRPMNGETLTAYRVRLLNGVKEHSVAFKGVDIGKLAIADATALDSIIEPKIYADAMDVAKSPSNAPEGQLRCVTKKSDSGHIIREWYGSPSTWMDDLAGPVRNYVTKFNTQRAA